MAIQNRIFERCDGGGQQVFQYNDIFFTPGTVAFYDNYCWQDTEVDSSLIPVAEVSFSNFSNCTTCTEANLDAVILTACNGSGTEANLTLPPESLPAIGTFVYFNEQCWEVTSESSELYYSDLEGGISVYESCDICETINGSGSTYSAVTFTNCCDDSDIKTFLIQTSNFGFPFGETVIFNNNCYTYAPGGPSSPAVGTFGFPQYLNCNSCQESSPCPSPTPTSSVTPTPTVTPTKTPTNTPTSTVTPTPTKTPFLSPSPSYTTTTTTRPTERNECEPITLFPLGVECLVTNPTSATSFDGSVSLFITGGTAPYQVYWSNGISGTTALYNLGSGTFSAVVIDYYGDFTGTTICDVVAPTPTPTQTPTVTPTPTSSPTTTYGNLCVTFVINGVPYQYQFAYYSVINGYPSWTSSTYNSPITTSGETLYLNWNNAVLSPDPTPPSGWGITGFDSPTWFPVSSTLSVPPLSGWFVQGSSPGVQSVTVTLGPCPAYPEVQISTIVTDSGCGETADGSICITAQGGSSSFQYSIDNGVTYFASNCFYNLAPGSYSIVVKDMVTLTQTTQSVLVGGGITTTVSLGFTQVSNQNLISSPSTLYNLRVFNFNTNDIPVGVTVGVNFNLNLNSQIWEPGDGNSLGSQFIIEKNGTPISLSGPTTSFNLTNRPSCSPYKIQESISAQTASTSVIKTDTLVLKIYNRSTVTDPFTDNCSTRVVTNMNSTASLNYSGVDDCLVINGISLSVGSQTSRTLGFS